MRRPRVCLFTSFHPDHGGGPVILRSALENFDRIDVSWLYLGRSESRSIKATRIGSPLFGGPVIADMIRSPLLWAGWRNPEMRSIVRRLLAEQADAYWVIAMNEGILAGQDLVHSGAAPVHVSVQDDQAEAICRRSRRYRWMQGLAGRAWQDLLSRASSVDVISKGMQDYYARVRGISSFVCHPCLAQPVPTSALPSSGDELRVGHIGNLYSATEVTAFLNAALQVADRLGRRLKAVFINDSAIAGRLQRSSPALAPFMEVIGEQPEDTALEQLSSCHVLYSMYPFEERCRVFRTTSIPIKLRSYIQARRPVFAHTPADSTLASFVRDNSVGGVCTSLDPHEIAAVLTGILTNPPAPENYELARQREYGRDQMLCLEDTLIRLVAAAPGPPHQARASR